MASNGNGNGGEYENAITREKPLNQTQLKNLREVVSGDFQDLQEQVRVEVNRRAEAKKEEIRERYRDVASLEEARQKVTDLVRKFEDEVEELKEEIRGTESLTIKEGRLIIQVTGSPDSIKQEGLHEELAKIGRAADDVVQTANRVLAREKRTVDRQCLLQGISAFNAHQLINDLPTAEDILPLVNTEIALHSGESMAALFDPSEIEELETSDE